MTIITYGGGEVLFQLFTGIKLLFSSGTVHTLAFLMASLTALYALFSSYFSLNPTSLFKQFLLPIVALVTLCFSVKTTIYIEDVLPLTQGGVNILSKEAFDSHNQNVTHAARASWSVDHVPFIIGFLAKTISSLGYKMTLAVESIFHTADDPKYSKTGMIFGAETALDMNEIIIQDGNLEANLRTFCKTCMLYDLALNLYTVKDLKNQTNLLDFLKENSAKSRFMNYTSSREEETNSPPLLSCQEAIARIAKKLEKGGVEVAHQAKKQIFRSLPIAYQALTKQSGDSAELIQQMLTMSVISEELSSEAFATKRAALQQKTAWKTMGGIADGLVVTTRCVIEALIYGAIIFVIPFLFLPSGFTYLKTWVWLLVWIQLWPPFYAILDYVSLIAARGQAEGLFDPESANQCCLTLYNTIGLSTVYGNISAYAKSMKILIPPLSYAILQGGVGSFVHLTSSMMGASQQAATAAASDELSGNYQFGNTSMSTSGFANTTYGQQNYSSSFGSGYIKQDTARGSALYGLSDSTVQENVSRFSFGLSEDKAIQSSLTKTHTDAKTAHEASTTNLGTTISNAGRSVMDYTHHMAHDSSYSSAHTAGQSQEASTSAQFCENQVEAFAKDHGMSKQQAWEIFGSISSGIEMHAFNASVGVSGRSNSVTNDAWNNALSVSESSEFRQAFNQVKNHASNHSHSQTDGEGHRLATSFTDSIDQAQTVGKLFSTTLDQMHQTSEAASFYQNQTFSERTDLSQKLLDYSIQEKGYSVKQFQNLLHNNDNSQLSALIADFSQPKIPTSSTLSASLSPTAAHAQSEKRLSHAQLVPPTINSNFTSQTAPFTGGIKKQVQEKLQDNENHEMTIAKTQAHVLEKKEGLKGHFSQKVQTKEAVNRRELELETLWMDSFDDDLLPSLHHKEL